MRRIYWSRPALKDLARLDGSLVRRIVAAVEGFAASGRGDIKHLKGQLAGELRLRVADQRVLLESDAQEIRVLHVLDRDEAYR